MGSGTAVLKRQIDSEGASSPAEETGCDDCRLPSVSSTGERFRLRQGVAVRHDDVNSEDVVRAVTDAEAPEFPGDFICVSGKDLDLTADTTDGTAQIQVAGHWHLIRSSSPRLAGMRLAATRSTQISDLRESRVTPRAHHGVGEGP